MEKPVKPKRKYVKKNKPKQPQQLPTKPEEINLVIFDFVKKV
jgi:hypothetical protein